MTAQTIFRVVNPNKSYTKLSNVLLADRKLSFETKGFLVSILMLPPNWAFNVTWLLNQYGIKKDAAYRLIRDAGQAGYCRKIETRRPNGTIAKVEYHFSDDPAEFVAATVVAPAPSCDPAPSPETEPLPENPEVDQIPAIEPLPAPPVLAQPLPVQASSGSATSGKSRHIQRKEKDKQLKERKRERASARKGSLDLKSSEGWTAPESARLLSDDWTLPDEWRAWATKEGPEHVGCIDTEARSFKRRFVGSGIVKVDWFAEWRIWYGRTLERPAPAAASAPAARGPERSTNFVGEYGKNARRGLNPRDCSETMAEYTSRMIREGKFTPKPGAQLLRGVVVPPAPNLEHVL